MIKNYFKTAWRNLFRNKAFSAINISGLALGMTCSLLILLWVQDERNVDGFHTNNKQLYQVYERQYANGTVDASYITQGLLAEELKKQVPEIQYASSLDWNMPYTLEAGNKINKMEGNYAGADFFSMFSYRLLQGTPQTALNSPEAIAISRNAAMYFFGSPEKAIGQTIRYENKTDLQVKAVFENMPTNSSVRFDFLRSWQAYVKENDWVNNWSNFNPSTFIQLRADANPVATASKIKDFIHRYIPANGNVRYELGLQPYSEKYLHANFSNGQPAGGRIEYVQLLTLVAVFILLIACINFMNLATARSAKRAKEVGVRKVVGAFRSTLIGQFIGEAMLVTAFAVIIAVVLTDMLLPAFNALTGKQLLLPLTQPVFWGALLALLIITSFVAGSYPALFLSSLNPIHVLKGSLKFSPGAAFFRKGLVVLQFALSTILMVGMIVIYRQMEYAQSKNLGYDRENLVYIPLEGDLAKNYSVFKDEAGKLPGALNITKMRETPTVIAHHIGDVSWPGKDPNLVTSIADAIVGYDFVKTMNLELVEGHDFMKGVATDSTGFLLNEMAIQKMGLKDPVGQTITWGERKGMIIGVLKDFHFNSMHQAIEPLVIRLREEQPWGTILVRIKAGSTQQTLAGLEKLCHSLNPQFPFTYQFADLEYDKLYKSEQVISKLSNYFAFLAIFISCLGLFGLAAFTAEQRTKEIGVRKVLGASVPDIIVLLSVNFLKPVAIAILVAFPISRYLMNRWLQDFAYKVSIEWWIFALTGLLTIGIALLTVSFQSINAAFTNPVKSLRSE
ncbi:FtsX-like permease family protein [Pseudoflavitalea sp. X16]|uniref:ABC transporter permease n=1 Tax=Paraflavitalea devenefica TaxID=2716334 RepID=UPI0014235BF3|nr:ABC transporter permease [Paraflavitalea devenefica]NII26895.1 FtsX-like permease family protein [Paraflavitalea devenefica]